MLSFSKKMMARLPFNEIDLLIVDEMGKNISGIWMAVHRVAVSLEPTGETCLSSSIVAFSGSGISKGRIVN